MPIRPNSGVLVAAAQPFQSVLYLHREVSWFRTWPRACSFSSNWASWRRLWERNFEISVCNCCTFLWAAVSLNRDDNNSWFSFAVTNAHFLFLKVKCKTFCTTNIQFKWMRESQNTKLIYYRQVSFYTSNMFLKNTAQIKHKIPN